VRYSSLFVTPAHRGRARALALLTEAFRRQHAAGLGGDQRIRGIDRIGNRELTAGHPRRRGLPLRAITTSVSAPVSIASTSRERWIGEIASPIASPSPLV